MIRAALVIALIFVTEASAQEDGLGGDVPKTQKKEAKKEESHLLPIHPLENAKEGDWSAFVWTMKAGPREEKSTDHWKVAKVDGGKIEVHQRSAKDNQGFDQKEPPAVEKFLGMTGNKVTELKVEDEKKTVGDHAFATKKVTFKSDDGRRVFSVALWLSKDVKGSGIVAIHIEGDLEKDTKFTADLEVAGYGSKDKTEFGKSLEDVQKDVDAANKKMRDDAAKEPAKKP